MKMHLLSNLFTRITPRQLGELERLVRFIVYLFGQYFLTGPLSGAASCHDLELRYNFQMYVQVDLVGKAVMSMKHHLWYLAPELVVLALFGDQEPTNEKQLLTVSLLNKVKPAQLALDKPVKLTCRPILDHLQDQEKPPLLVFLSQRS